MILLPALPALSALTLPPDSYRLRFAPATITPVAEGDGTFMAKIVTTPTAILVSLAQQNSHVGPAGPDPRIRVGRIVAPVLVNLQVILETYGPSANGFSLYRSPAEPNVQVAVGPAKLSAKVGGPPSPATATAWAQAPEMPLQTTSVMQYGPRETSAEFKALITGGGVQGDLGLKSVIAVPGTSYYRAIYRGTLAWNFGDVLCKTQNYLNGYAAGRTTFARSQAKIRLVAADFEF